MVGFVEEVDESVIKSYFLLQRVQPLLSTSISSKWCVCHGCNVNGRRPKL